MTRQSAAFRLVQNQNDDTPRTAAGLSDLCAIALRRKRLGFAPPVRVGNVPFPYRGGIHLVRATSFHPMENGTRTHPMNPEIFVGRCLLLQNHGFNVTVNVVAWPEQMYLIPAWAEMLRSHGLRFHFDPYSSIAYYPYEYSEAERRYLEPWIWENRRAELRTPAAGRTPHSVVLRRRRSHQRPARWLRLALHSRTATCDQPAGQRV